VDEEQNGGGIDKKMRALPPLSPDAQAIQRGYDDKDEEIKSYCAERILHRLERRPDWKEDIEQAKVNPPYKEKNNRVNQRERNGCVCRDPVGVEEIEVAVRPVFHWTVAHRHR
jgi:hypothetical protein